MLLLFVANALRISGMGDMPKPFLIQYIPCTKHRSLLSFDNTPLQMTLYRGLTEKEDMVMEKLHDFGGPTLSNIIRSMNALFINKDYVVV